jgi:NAD(P)-dependent dehydrogenase (short-subunit alcohol dehydrogenase family)
VRAKRASEEIKNLFNLEGKVAVVTGASGALGRAVSLGLAIHGVDIVACSVEEDGLLELAAEIDEATGRKVLPVFCDVMDVNLKGTLICCRAVARRMIERGEGGSIITVGSVRGFHAHKDGYTAYGTSKAAVHYLTKQMAFEWAEHHIRVNCIAPCVFWSPLTEPILSDNESYLKYTSRIPMGRAAEPEDFIGATIFLASDASEMVTAHILSVDGGTAGG